MLSLGLHDIPEGTIPMIVTYLEMHSPAPTRPASSPKGAEFKKISPDLARYRDIFRRVGGLEWLWSSRLEHTDTELQQIIKNPKVEIYTLICDGRDEALLELDFREDGACELAFFGLTPALIGTGAGRFLMNEAITRAWAKPITRFHVHTCTIDSPQALSFYQRSGFTPYKRRVEVCPDPRLDGYLPLSAGSHIPLLKS